MARLFFIGTALCLLGTSLAEESIQPRSLGAEWLYTSTLVEKDGALVPDGLCQEKVVEIGQMEGHTIFRIRVREWRLQESAAGFADVLASEHDEEYHFWEYMTDQGSYHFEEDEENPTSPSALSDFGLSMPYPTEVGHTYKVEEDAYEVLTIDREVTVAAGTYETVVYQLTFDDEGEPQRERYFQAPGHGLVQWELDQWEDGQWRLAYRDELVSYSEH
ncbi:MAG: hypothetical protein ACFCU3_04805 [Verrucomicrobiales bacterium]